jgi:hypothetical protein
MGILAQDVVRVAPGNANDYDSDADRGKDVLDHDDKLLTDKAVREAPGRLPWRY